MSLFDQCKVLVTQHFSGTYAHFLAMRILQEANKH